MCLNILCSLHSCLQPGNGVCVRLNETHQTGWTRLHWKCSVVFGLLKANIHVQCTCTRTYNCKVFSAAAQTFKTPDKAAPDYYRFFTDKNEKLFIKHLFVLIILHTGCSVDGNRWGCSLVRWAVDGLLLQRNHYVRWLCPDNSLLHSVFSRKDWVREGRICSAV